MEKWKYLGPATKWVFGQPMYLGSHWLESPDGFKHMANPVYKSLGRSKKTRKYRFKLVGWDVGKYGILKSTQVKGYKKLK